MNIRPIEPVNIADLDYDKPETGEPICERVDPKTLFVDPAYQRSVGERGLRQIRKIIEAWCWTKFKPPIVAYADHEGGTVLKVLDGQHTAIAAASHPHIDMIPVMIVEAAETAAQAAAFVGQNTQRVAVTPLQVFFAELTAGDPDAIDVQNTCDRAGVTIVRTPPSRSDFKPAETLSISAIKGLVDRRGVMKARMILEVLAKANLAPITADHIKATEYLMTEPEFCDAFDPEDLTREIETSGKAAEHEAKVFSVAQKVPMWRALAVQWFKKTRKKRKVAA